MKDRRGKTKDEGSTFQVVALVKSRIHFDLCYFAFALAVTWVRRGIAKKGAE